MRLPKNDLINLYCNYIILYKKKEKKKMGLSIIFRKCSVNLEIKKLFFRVAVISCSIVQLVRLRNIPIMTVP